MITPVVDAGLGNSAYLVDLGDGQLLAVDPCRDLRALRRAAGGRPVAFAAETHLHADFVSAATQLAASDRATVLASADGDRRFAHTGLRDGEEYDLGGLTLRALATPGHTFEHLSYVLFDGTRALAVFTGGSLMVGTAARTDLAGDEHTIELARAQYRSLHRLMQLPDGTPVYPTHGGGSFCSAPGGGDRTTTIGRERAANPLLAAADEDTFVADLLAGFGTYPAYFGWLPEVNRCGPATGVQPAFPSLDVTAADKLLASGAEVVDVRPIADYAAGHIPGSLSIQLREAFASWLGWLVERDRPLVLVRNADQDPDEVTWQAIKIGYEKLAGELGNGVAAWQAAGRPLARTPLVSAGSVQAESVLDIRQDGEFRAGHLPGSAHVELGRLAELAARLPAHAIATMCGHGERAATAASILERAGREAVIVTGGPDDWAAATGHGLVS